MATRNHVGPGPTTTATALVANSSRRYPWAIWLPAGISAALVLIIAVTFLSLGRRLDATRRRLADVLEPTSRRLQQFQLAYLDELAFWRAYQLEPAAPLLEQVRTRHERTRRIMDDLSAKAPRVEPRFVSDVGGLRELLERWSAAPVAVMEGHLSPQAARRLLQPQVALADAVITRSAQLDSALSLQTQRLVGAIQPQERRRLTILTGLFPLALLGIALTAWLARQSIQIQRRLLRKGELEALLRDSMAALTGIEVVPTALGRIATNAMRVARADGVFIEESDEARTKVEIAARAGAIAGAVGTRLAFVGSITDALVRAGTRELAVDLAAQAGAIGSIVGGPMERCSAFAVPLQDNGDVHGALVLVGRDRPLEIGGDTTSALQALGAWAALALRRQGLASQLEAERARLEAVVREMPVGVVLAEAPSGRLALFNRQAIELYGSPVNPPREIAEYAGWKTFRLDGQPYDARQRPLARSILEGEVVQGEEAEIERTDGTRRTVLINSAPIRNARGAIIAGVATMSDISEEKRREQSARFLDEISRQLASSLDYEATIEAILTLLVPRIGDLVSVHHRRDDMIVRRSASAATDPRINQLFQSADTEFPLPLPSADPVAVAIRTGKPQLREAVDDELLKAIARDDRQLDWLRSLGLQSTMVAPLTVRGKTIGALRIVSVTKGRRFTCNDLAFAEEIARRAALAIDNAELFHKVTESGKVSRFLAEASHSLSASLEYEEVLNRVTRLAVPFFADFTMAYMKNGKGPAQHVASAHRDASKVALLAEAASLYKPDPANEGCTVVRALTTGEPVLVERVTAELLDREGFAPRVRELFGELAPVSWMTVPLVARDETLGTIVFASIDDKRRYETDDLTLGQTIASRVALAMQNAMLYRKVQEALTTRDEVLAIVSHDLRNPLHTIGMTVQLLHDIPLEDMERRRHLQVIGRAKDRMDRLIQDLLDVARVEAGKALIFEPRRERPKTIIPEACESFIMPAREKQVQLTCHVAGEISDVLVDRGRIMQVLSNLIANALKFTPEGGRIEVTAVQDQGVILVSVLDTGPGIPSEDLERIFHAFWQAPRASRLGAGLGLAISRGIVQQHGGRLWVESREGAGAKFLFTLPSAGERQQALAD